MPKKKQASSKFSLFGHEFDYKDYVKRLMPEGKFQAEKMYKKIGLNKILKPTPEVKTKYWDCNKKYPTTIDSFVEKFFKKKKPKNLEGIWQQEFNGQTVTYGLVEKSGAYHGYMISNQLKVTQTTGSFFKDIFLAPEVDYSITDGTKFGVYYYDKKRKGSVNDKKFMKFKGIATIIDTYSFEQHFPLNIEMNNDVTQVNERHLMGESDMDKVFEEKLGFSRSSHKIWPLIKVKEVPKDHPGYKGWNEIGKVWVQCSDKNCKDYSNHFQVRVASLEFRVCPECGKKLKTVEGKINPNSQGSGVVNPNEEDKKKSGVSVGSGFFVSNKGHIVTNYHVVKDCDKNIKFLFNDEELEAKLIASDQQLDLALLKSKIENKSFVKFSNKSPQKAQNILVAGFPYGKAISDDLKVTAGIINSLKGIGNNTSMLQVDATINPGNSGGPIVDKDTGNLVAVATMKLSKDFTKQAFGVESENTNYGIKSSQVKDFLEANKLKVTIKKNKFKISELENSTVFIYCK